MIRILVALIFFSTSVNAGLPPTTLRGQDGSKKTVFNYEVPKNQATQTGSTSGLIETGNDNLLSNPGFEASSVVSGWTLSNGAASADITTEYDGNKAASIALTAVTGTVIEQNVATCSKYFGSNMEMSMQVNTASTTIQACSLSGGVEAQCTSIPSTGLWNRVTLNLPAPSSGSCGIRIKTTGSTTGTVKLDKSYVGLATNIGTVAQAKSVLVAERSTTQAVATTAETLITATAESYDPNNAFSGGIYTVPEAGTYGFSATIQLANATTTEQFFFRWRYNNTVYTPCFVVTFPTAGSETVTVSCYYQANAGDTFRATIQSTADASYDVTLGRWSMVFIPNSDQIAMRANTPSMPTVQKFTATGAGTYTPSIGVKYIKVRMVGGGGGGSGGSTHTANNGGNGGVGTSSEFGSPVFLTASGGQGASGGTSTGGAAGGSATVSAPAVLIQSITGSGGANGLTNNTTTTTGAPGGVGGMSVFGGGSRAGAAGSAAGAAGFAGSGSGGAGGGGPTSNANGSISGSGGGAGGFVEAFIAAPLAGSYPIFVGPGGAGGTAGTSGFAGSAGGSGQIEVIEYYGTENAPLLIGSVTSSFAGPEKLERAAVSCSGTPTVDSQSGSWVSSIAQNATGDCTLTIASGAFSGPPTCQCTVRNSGSYLCAIHTAPTATTVRIIGFLSNTAVATNLSHHIYCMGPK